MADTTTASLTLDRHLPREYLTREYGEPVGLSALSDHLIAGPGAIANAISDARNTGALGGVDDVEVIAYALDDAVLIALREAGQRPALRQVSTLSIETKYLVGRDDDDGLETLADVIDRVLSHADELVPTLRRLQAAERGAGGGGGTTAGWLDYLEDRRAEMRKDLDEQHAVIHREAPVARRSIACESQRAPARHARPPRERAARAALGAGERG